MSRSKIRSAAEAVAASAPPLATAAPEPARGPCKLATIIALLNAPDGATIDDLCAATGWQSHSVRGAIAGSLKRKGHVVTSTKLEDSPRRYRIEASA